MAAMAALTFLVLSTIPVFRIGDALAGRVRPDDFKLGESDRVPERTKLSNRNYMNLLELPLLFYVVCGIIYMTDSLTWPQLGLAWAFVAFRAMHSVLHLTINIVLVRLSMFAGAAFTLAALWIVTFVHLAALG